MVFYFKILPVVSIAMKSYLLASFLFLQILALPVSTFAQENEETSDLANNENVSDQLNFEDLSDDHEFSQAHEHQDYEGEKNSQALHKGSNFHDLEEMWPSHLPSDGKSFEAKFFNMLIILFLLIGFMFLASWSLKRMMKSKLTNLNTGSSIKVLETRYLSPRATLYIVEVEGQSLLIAESPTTVTHLKTFRLEEGETDLNSIVS